MAIRNSWPGPSEITTQTDARLDLAGLIMRDVAGVPRGGIFPRHTNALVTARSDMKVDVASFEGASIRGGGPLFQANDGTVQVPIATAPGSNSRLDVIYFKQDESASPYSDADDTAILASQAGVPVASPVLADTLALLPAGAEPLYSVLVPAGKTATNQAGVVITPIFRYTTVVGGVIFIRGIDDLAVTSGYLAMNNYVAGTKAYDISTGITHRWNGTAWKQVFRDTFITPSSVVVGSGSYVINEDGSVTVTGASSVTFNGVHPANAIHTACDVEIDTATVSTTLNARMVVGGSPQTGTDYRYEVGIFKGTTTTAPANGVSVSSAQLSDSGLSFYGTVHFYNANKATATYLMTDLVAGVSGVAPTRTTAAALHGVSSAMDGVQFIPNAGGTITGTFSFRSL